MVNPAAAVAGDQELDRVLRMKFLEQQYGGFDGRRRFEADYRTLVRTERESLDLLLKRSVIGASSRMERFFHLDLRARGIDSIPNYRLGPYTWDVGIEEGTVVVDLDSVRYHSSEQTRAFIIDRWKANHAEMEGWGHLQFTDLCLDDSSARKAALQEIEQLLAHRRRTGRGAPVDGRVVDGVWKIHGHLREY
ncbi:hypothetical protein [Corynebacterium hylobatis]|uniref:hypothetical protein n=1 Tax=Corynebacterium hylobatis TaxID=1859290 RepID=UPI001F497520|nr:hypothetical protein [Corynebacterium hylobatis]